MDAQVAGDFLRFCAGLKDPRRHNVVHRFTDLLTIAILAVLCKSDDWIEVVEWAQANQLWLMSFLSLPRGIPSADTFRRLFARIDPDAFERCFIAWTASLAQASGGRVVAVDGKTLRRSFAHAWDKQGAMHMVSAWCVSNQLVLGQLAVEGRSNEITAIPQLLALLELSGALVTIDAMGCQKEIAQKILERGADYLLAVKDNQLLLHQKVQGIMQGVSLDLAKHLPVRCGFVERTDSGHGRIETRRVWVSDEIQSLGKEILEQWPGLGSLVMVQCVRQDLGDTSGKISTERRYYISSLKGIDVAPVADAVRQHWGVENSLHWRLDMSFREDESRIRKEHGAENFSRLRRIVLNKLKNFDTQRRVSIKTKRYRCSIDHQYLLDLLQQ